jgi:hypothetical protein
MFYPGPRWEKKVHLTANRDEYRGLQHKCPEPAKRDGVSLRVCFIPETARNQTLRSLRVGFRFAGRPAARAFNSANM